MDFTGDRVFGWLEVYKDKRLYLHDIISRQWGKGNVQALFRGWLERGYDLRVVMPHPIMRHILQKFGFSLALGYFPDHYEDRVEIWYRPVSTDILSILPGKSVAAGAS